MQVFKSLRIIGLRPPSLRSNEIEISLHSENHLSNSQKIVHFVSNFQSRNVWEILVNNLWSPCDFHFYFNGRKESLSRLVHVQLDLAIEEI